jgi:phosphoenolpyruvate synthase/pyruvate phosphate dikinase
MVSQLIRWFREIGLSDLVLVRGKNASLGELYHKLTLAGIRVPNGFAVTAGVIVIFCAKTVSVTGSMRHCPRSERPRRSGRMACLQTPSATTRSSTLPAGAT